MTAWHVMDISKIEKELKTSDENGLDKKEATRRLKKNGMNIIKQKRRRNIILRFADQFKDFMIIILMISAVISFLIGEKTDSYIILIIVFVNALIGFVQEGKAERSIESLKKLTKPRCKVIRNGKVDVIPSEELVMGDLVVLEAGDSVPADMRLTESINLSVQEASFTGETVPVNKVTNIMFKENITIGDMKNMAFSSSLVTYGRGKGIVVATGMNTQIGKIANYIQESSEQDTPLKKRLEQLGKLLGITALIICFVIFLMGMVIYKMEIFEIFLVSISLAVAAIPEGLPTVATIVLAIGVQKMAKKKAIIRKLPSVETLGSTTVICSDKTGTLTQNKMTVKKVCVNNCIEEFNKGIKITNSLELLVSASIFCNDTKIKKDMGRTITIGDPTETALVDMANDISIDKDKLDKNYPRVYEIPFDSTRKCMTTVHKVNGKYIAYVKGGFDEILTKCSQVSVFNSVQSLNYSHETKLKNANLTMTKEALRVIAVAYKEMDNLVKDNEYIEKDLIFIGLVGMMDPPRPEVKEAIRKCKTAGIKTIMITGDHKVTAMMIAKNLGIVDDESQVITGSEIDTFTDSEFAKKVKMYSVYARVSPEHKVKIVKALKVNNEVVAMTGDGVNDAPALKGADIGIAMGNIGTDVAKEASDMILANDNFATIVSAVEEGRRIFDNISKAIIFLLSCNIGEIFTIFFAMIFGYNEPLLPIHILWINLVTDTFPALALGVDRAEDDIMKKMPKKVGNTMLKKKDIIDIAYQGITIAIVTLFAFYIGYKTDEQTAQTMAFAVLGFSQIIHSFTIHLQKKSMISMKIFSNKYLIFAAILTSMLMLAVLVIPEISALFKFAKLDTTSIFYIAILSFTPMFVVECVKKFRKM